MTDTQGRVDPSEKAKVTAGAALVAAVALPFAILTAMIVLEKEFEDGVPWFGTAAPLWVSLAIGVMVLAARFRVRALLIAIAYLPLMFVALLFFGFWFVARFYDDFI